MQGGPSKLGDPEFDHKSCIPKQLHAIVLIVTKNVFCEEK